jgi:hypothetical protein
MLNKGMKKKTIRVPKIASAAIKVQEDRHNRNILSNFQKVKTLTAQALIKTIENLQS